MYVTFGYDTRYFSIFKSDNLPNSLKYHEENIMFF